MTKINTFGDYVFDKWVPERTRELITEFWGQMGRTYLDWLDNIKNEELELCHHGPNPNGFGCPPNGATAQYFQYEHKLSRELGKEIYTSITGRYLHRWNNIGSLIDEKGVDHTVSSCDKWVRIFTGGEEKRLVTKKV